MNEGPDVRNSSGQVHVGVLEGAFYFILDSFSLFVHVSQGLFDCADNYFALVLENYLHIVVVQFKKGRVSSENPFAQIDYRMKTPGLSQRVSGKIVPLLSEASFSLSTVSV